MELSEIISISGQGGLFKVIAKSTNGLIVESLSDKKRIPVHSTQKVSALQDISIFTNNEDMPLKDVFLKIYEKENGGSTAVNHKAEPAALKKYFESVLPEYDQDRVYVSDIKKVVQWYNLLQTENLLTPEPAEEKEKKKKSASKAEGEKEAKSEETKSSKTKEPKKAGTAGGKSPKTASKAKTSAPKATKAKAAKTQTVRKTGA